MSSTPREDVYDSNKKERPLAQQVHQALPQTTTDFTAGHDFSAPPSTHSFAALLFDMDGTIIDSTPAIVKYWHALGREIGVSGDKILETSHGRRSIDVLALLAPDKANWEYVCEAEARVPREHGQDATEIPGARALLDSLSAQEVPWAIVTSGTKGLVSGWLDVMKLSRPEVLVSAEEVTKGKPDPEGYKMGAGRLGMHDGITTDEGLIVPIAKPSEILVLEDAPAGVRAGKAAGYRVVALATTHAVEKLREAGADWILRDLRSVKATVGGEWSLPRGSRVMIEIRDALVIP